jgi:mannosylglycerate hydrolase MGH1-like protein
MHRASVDGGASAAGMDDTSQGIERMRAANITDMTKEELRLESDRKREAYWRRWGPYLSDRQWGTVREDYSAGGSAWEYFPHDHARSRAYRWGEDGIAGISDNHQRLCFSLALWNGHDPILKERLFGLTGDEGNHGEDVKEYYYYLDNTPTHAYMRGLYKYPQAAYPYADLVAENRRRGKRDPEFELIDTGVFDESRYWDVYVEYAKAAPNDILIRITAANRGPDRASLTLLPTLWFRNTWSWFPGSSRPSLHVATDLPGTAVEALHGELGRMLLECDGTPHLMFTENETNRRRLYGIENESPYVKDAFHAYVVDGQAGSVNPLGEGTKCAARYDVEVEPGASRVISLRLHPGVMLSQASFGPEFEATFERRKAEADEFYQRITPFSMSDDMRAVQRQAFAGMLWTKQYYGYIVKQWLDGDPAGPPPPPERLDGRNHQWVHVYADDVLSMPDKWEYPWFAAWDLAFHVVTLATIDPDFAKRQLLLLTREWYMHPNGQLPAYEWAFDDVNPPVHAWAALRVFRIEKEMYGRADTQFLERVFQKLLMNFTWWLNRKDADENDIFQGGFLGLDNIGVFDRSAELPTGGHIDQADGTSWMGMYCMNMLSIALELALEMPAYEDIASKFFEHFLRIAEAMNHVGENDIGLWDDEDGFYYDVLHLPNGHHEPLRVRSTVGLAPLFAVATAKATLADLLPKFERRVDWFIAHRPDLAGNVASMLTPGVDGRRLLAIVNRERLSRILYRMLDEAEFLSPHGVRALSKYHKERPFELCSNGDTHRVDYEPAESQTGTFGGNSNWRGPVWFPINLLIIEALQVFHFYYGDDFTIECPTGSGKFMNLWDVSMEIAHRLMGLFLRDGEGRRAVFGQSALFQSDPHWRDNLLFYEYFHGDNGAGLGASHQTGWTGIVAKLIRQCAQHCDRMTQSAPASIAFSSESRD